MIEDITSPQNSKVKLAASLKQKKYRDEYGLFLAEGLRLCEEAMKSDYQLEFCICNKEEMNYERMQALKERLQQKNCPIYQVNKQLYDKISDTKEPQGILLVIRKKNFCFENLIEKAKKPSIIVLDGIQDPGNLGTIIRTADAAGCSGIIIMKNTVDLFSAKAIRATMGSVFHLPIVLGVEPEKLAMFTAKNDIKLFITALDAKAKSYFEVDYTQGTAIVFGNEGNGVSDELLTKSDEKLFIPMIGDAESLNVSMAASVVMYEGLRQRLLAKS